MCTLRAEHDAGDRAADQRRGDVVEERRQHEDHHQQHERALPVVGQQLRQPRRNAAGLEMLRQQREAEQQAQQVGEQHPFVAEVRDEPRQARPFGERREQRSSRSTITTRPVTATCSVRRWNSATPSSVSANRMKSTGTGPIDGMRDDRRRRRCPAAAARRLRRARHACGAQRSGAEDGHRLDREKELRRWCRDGRAHNAPATARRHPLSSPRTAGAVLATLFGQRVTAIVTIDLPNAAGR